MNQPRNTPDLASQADVRARMADRLGFLLAKRWLQIQRESESVRAKKAVPADGSNQGKSKL